VNERFGFGLVDNFDLRFYALNFERVLVPKVVVDIGAGKRGDTIFLADC